MRICPFLVFGRVSRQAAHIPLLFFSVSSGECPVDRYSIEPVSDLDFQCTHGCSDANGLSLADPVALSHQRCFKAVAHEYIAQQSAKQQNKWYRFVFAFNAPPLHSSYTFAKVVPDTSVIGVQHGLLSGNFYSELRSKRFSEDSLPGFSGEREAHITWECTCEGAWTKYLILLFRGEFINLLWVQNISYALNFRTLGSPTIRTNKIFVRSLIAADSPTCFVPFACIFVSYLGSPYG